MIKAYVDGSFYQGKCGWGCVITSVPYPAGVLVERKGRLKDPQGHAQVGGELKATMTGLAWAINNDFHEMEIIYDFKGIRNWVTGEWQTNNLMARTYQAWMRNQIEEHTMLVYWTHVFSHTGNEGNERADQLAREGRLS